MDTDNLKEIRRDLTEWRMEEKMLSETVDTENVTSIMLLTLINQRRKYQLLPPVGILPIS